MLSAVTVTGVGKSDVRVEVRDKPLSFSFNSWSADRILSLAAGAAAGAKAAVVCNAFT